MFEEIKGREKFLPFKLTVVVTSCLDLIPLYPGTNTTSSNVKPFKALNKSTLLTKLFESLFLSYFR